MKLAAQRPEAYHHFVEQQIEQHKKCVLANKPHQCSPRRVRRMEEPRGDKSIDLRSTCCVGVHSGENRKTVI